MFGLAPLAHFIARVSIRNTQLITMTTREIQVTLAEGELIQWYRVERVLGRGGFGVTYLATDTNLDHKVAIKEYLPVSMVVRLPSNALSPVTGQSDPDYSLGLQRFLREARTLVKFRHPNIVRVMTVFEANNTAYLVMEYEEGEQFKSYVKRNGGVPEEKLRSLILSVIDGLDQVHQHGFIHRDIKPVNLIIRKDGTPVLIDFGSARPVNNIAEQAHTSFVSAGYTPLEQYQEGAGLKVGPWTDIYSLGATLYYAISGETPVSPTSRLAAHVKKSPDPLIPAREIGDGRYSSAFLDAIDWALGFQVLERPQTLSQWRKVLSPGGVAVEDLSPVSYQPGARGEESVTRAPRHLKSRMRRLDKPIKSTQRRVSGRFKPLFLVATLGVAGLAATLLYRKHIEDQRLDELLSRAELAFETSVESSVPLYRQVLGEFPKNQSALSRIDAIKTQLQKALEQDFNNGNLLDAERSLRILETIDSEKAEELGQRLSSLLMEQREQQDVASIERLLESGEYDSALSKLSELQEASRDPGRINTLEEKVKAARAAFKAQMSRLESDRLKREQAEVAARQRIAEANERQRNRRREYLNYLANSERALLERDTKSARKWLESARSLQIDDGELSDVEARVVASEAFAVVPLSAYEVSYSSGRFDSLRRAIESKNLRLISELTEPSPSRERFFESVFKRYTRVKASVIDIEARLEPKRVTATLRIDELALPNGDVVYPSPSYRDAEISLQRNQRSWSKINW